MRVVLVVLLAFVGLAAAAINPAAGPVDVQQQLKGHAYAKGGDGLKISCKALADAFPKGSEEEIKAQLDGPFDPAYEIGAIRISMALSANGVEIPSIPKSPGHVGTVALKSKKNVLPTMEMLTTFLKKTYGRPTYDIIGNVPVSKLASFPGIIRFKVSNKEAAAAASPAAASPSAPPPPTPPQVKGAPQPGDHNCEVCMFSLGQTEFGAKPDAAICGKTKALGDKAEASCKDILDQMHSKAGFFTQMREGGCEVRGTLVKPCPEPEICSKVKSALGTPFCPGATHKNALDIFDGKAGKLLGDKTDQVVQASRKVSVWTCQA